MTHKMRPTGSTRAIRLGLSLTVLVFAGCDRASRVVEPPPDTQPAVTQPGRAWWRQETVAAWTNLDNGAHEKWLDFVKQIGTTACDRGVFSVHAAAAGVLASATDYHHKRGLQLTSFSTINNWRPDEQYMAKLIASMRRDLDDGCDGIHLDMLFAVADPKRNVQESDAGARAVAKMRDAVHGHDRKPQAMFAGNTWKLDTMFSLQVASLCDVAWIESWGHDDLELVRIARVARSLGGGGKVAWYHWQPHDNEQARVEKLTNLPRALYSSCLTEGAVFLCNYQYPVPIVHRDQNGRKVTDWKMFPINPRWREAVVQYAQFAKKHADMLRDAKPLAPVIVAFRAERVGQANKIMRDLLTAKVAFNVHVSGRWPLRELEATDLAGYRAVISPDAARVRPVAEAPVYDSASAMLADAGAEIRDFCRVGGDAKVVTRVLAKDSRMFVHLKQYGYTDQADDIRAIGPLTLMLHCSGKIRRVMCLSPDRSKNCVVKFSQQGPQAKITVPTLAFYNLLVVDLDQ